MSKYVFNSSSPTPRKQPDIKTTEAMMQTRFKSKIILDELSIKVDSSANVEYSDARFKIENTYGVEFPIVKINDYYLKASEISSFTITANGFLPTISITANFTTNIFSTLNCPKDGDIISVAIKNKSDTLKIIRNDYVVTNTLRTRTGTDLDGQNPYTMYIEGELFIPGLKSAKYVYSHVGTSMSAIEYVAKQLNLGFVTNETNTDDKQLWLCTKSSPMQFIKETCERSWKDENSFYDCWIDIYYNLNYINVNKQLLKPEDNIDLAVYVSNSMNEFESKSMTDKKNTTAVPKVFCNSNYYRSSSFYITTWRPINKSTDITYTLGATSYCQLFEHNQKLYKNDEKYNWVLEISPIYDKNKTKNHYLFRGRCEQREKFRLPEDSMLANHKYVNIYESWPWLGIQYTISNAGDDNTKWDGNHHKNYLRARVHNTMNLKELEKITVEIDVLGVNLNVYRGDKIPIAIASTHFPSNKAIDQNSLGTTALDNFYSGWYYVKGFEINWDNETKGNLSNFTHTYIISRREWPLPINVDESTINKINNI